MYNAFSNISNHACNQRPADTERHHWRSSDPRPCSEQSKTEQVALGCIQSSFEHLQGWRLHNLSREYIFILLLFSSLIGCCSLVTELASRADSAVQYS